MPQWSETKASAFWAARKLYSVQSRPLLEERLQRIQVENASKEATRARQYAEFMEGRIFTPSNAPKHYTNTAKKLTFWFKYCSWSYCQQCGGVDPLPLLPSFENYCAIKCVTDCGCQKDRYCYPTYKNIPVQLKGLCLSDIIILRPFDIHCGPYSTKRNGYRQKTSLFRVKPSIQSVQNKISALPTGEQRTRCETAFNFLMNLDSSAYKHFNELRDELIEHADGIINTYDFEKTRFIECALWPHLYPYKHWCESALEGQDSRLSGKVAFWKKVSSEIIDYSTDYELLQYQYDRWLFKTVSGAISSARIRLCSPARALEQKTFSVTYWQWQHRYLLDAVRQHGPPTVFVTISPYEWTFPFPTFLDTARHTIGRRICNMAVLETTSIAHALEQVVRGYLCGSNTAKWCNNIFSYNRLKTTKNVLTYFYRFEFQERGTCHLHMLVWLKDISQIDLHHIRADIPTDSPQVAFDVYRCQKSDRKSAFLHEQIEQTYCSLNDTRKQLHLYHPKEAFVVNLRAYINTLLPSLKCAMDVQTSDGHGMLLRYVCSYVSKWHDAIPNDALYSFDVAGRQAAFTYLTSYKPLEPEMAMALSPIKVAWTQSNTKKYVPPLTHNISDDPMVLLYWDRNVLLENMSLIEWLRQHTIKGKTVKPYKNANTLVGVKYLSVFNSMYFFQYNVMNKPHRKLEDLYAKENEGMPSKLIHFANCETFFPQLWGNIDNIKHLFVTEGNAEHFVSTVIAYVASLKDTIVYFRRQILTLSSLENNVTYSGSAFPLTPLQQSIARDIQTSFLNRSRTYSKSTDACDEECHEECFHQQVSAANSHREEDRTWTSPILVTGKPGTGKTHAILGGVMSIANNDGNVLITCPTGFLASVFRSNTNEEIVCDTVHAAFKYPVNKSEYPTVNYDLSRYDVIVVDEISMIPSTIFHHILKTLNCLPMRPVLVLGGDNSQMQPFERIDGKTSSVTNVMSDKVFKSKCRKYNLTQQFRIVDEIYQRLLDKLRYWKPSDEDISLLMENRVLLTTDNPCEKDIIGIVEKFPTFHFLTYTKKAATFINTCVINSFCKTYKSIGKIQMDWEDGTCHIFAGMAIIFTQNRDKTRGMVNGQKGVIKYICNSTIFVDIANGSILSVYPVSKRTSTGNSLKYPFMPAYAVTICKSQGQTLDNIILWLDIDNVAPGAGYVALSRVKGLTNLRFLCPIRSCQFNPVRLE